MTRPEGIRAESEWTSRPARRLSTTPTPLAEDDDLSMWRGLVRIVVLILVLVTIWLVNH